MANVTRNAILKSKGQSSRSSSQAKCVIADEVMYDCIGKMNLMKILIVLSRTYTLKSRKSRYVLSELIAEKCTFVKSLAIVHAFLMVGPYV